MNSEILNNMGLGDIDAFYIFIILFSLIIILLVMVIILMVSFFGLKKRFQRFMTGRNAQSLEEGIAGIFRDISMLKEHDLRFKSDIKEIKTNLLDCYQKVGVVKYDAFREMGGQLSFSIALLDKQDNGFILNSVHSANGCYTYTKEIQNGLSYIDLAEEEREALSRAMRATPVSKDAQVNYQSRSAAAPRQEDNYMQQAQRYQNMQDPSLDELRDNSAYDGMGYDIPERSYSSRQDAMGGVNGNYGGQYVNYNNGAYTGSDQDNNSDA